MKKEKNMNFKNLTKLFVIVLFSGFVFQIQGKTSTKSKKKVNAGYYSCTMHKSVHEHKSGSCPICNMKLEFKKQEDHKKDHDISDQKKPDKKGT